MTTIKFATFSADLIPTLNGGSQDTVRLYYADRPVFDFPISRVQRGQMESWDDSFDRDAELNEFVADQFRELFELLAKSKGA